MTYPSRRRDTVRRSLFVAVSTSVTQSATTVTGTPGNDSTDCSAADPAKQINGLAGDDAITGTAFGDTIDGGVATTP
jgi:hypothetical protein